MDKEEKDTYEVSITCTNCEYNGSLTVEMGKTVASQVCPNCGCIALRLYHG